MMIENLLIKDFKCFDRISLDFSNLTLLSGVNAGGKSSIIQALLLLSQNITTNGLSTLNGHLISIGEFSDARNFVTNAREFTIEVAKNEERVAYQFKEENDNCTVEKIKSNDKLEEFFNYTKHSFNYLSASRIGVKDIYNKNLDQIDKYGIFGEYSIAFLDKNKPKPLNNGLIKDKNSKTLIAQVNYWLKDILNTEIVTEDIIGTDRVKAKYSYNDSRKIRPSNIGSGISYIISILVICLSANKDDLIIIENPEIHLHPKAQSKLTDFFVFIANYGIQLIIESHSDHIFNGIRKNVKIKEIDKENTSIYFFNIINSLSKPIKIQLNKHGQVENHQKGLFDQFDDDLNELLGL